MNAPAADRLYLVTQTFTLLALVAILKTGLLPALLGGLLVYFLVEFGSRQLGRMGIIPERGKVILLFFIALAFIALLALAVLGIVANVSTGPESMVAVLRRMADVVEGARTHLPAWTQQYLPDSFDEWQRLGSEWLRENAGYFSRFGTEAGAFLLHLIFGIIIGGLIAVSHGRARKQGPLARALIERADFLATAFHRIIFSQIRISALNTFFTGIFLAVVLPLLGQPLPLTKTMIVITFVAGLLPIVGNLISNTVIFLIALSVSPIHAVGALTYLIVIHKLEYFINAHIIGTRIKAQAWEILLAMLVMEALFGLPGLVAAPIYYAYIKDELSAQKLI